MVETEMNHSQKEINSVLKRGIIFSIIWLAGIGSLIAIMSGLKARRLILHSNGALLGMGRVWWCIVFGSLGMAIWLPIVVIGIINNLSR
jgi:hypothetical protein